MKMNPLCLIALFVMVLSIFSIIAGAISQESVVFVIGCITGLVSLIEIEESQR